MVQVAQRDFLQFQQIGSDAQRGQLDGAGLVLAVEPGEPLKALIQLVHALQHRVRTGAGPALGDVRHHQQDDHLHVLHNTRLTHQYSLIRKALCSKLVR